MLISHKLQYFCSAIFRLSESSDGLCNNVTAPRGCVSILFIFLLLPLRRSNSLRHYGPPEIGFSLLIVAAAALWMTLLPRFPPGISSSAVPKTAAGMTAGQIKQRESAVNRILYRLSKYSRQCSADRWLVTRNSSIEAALCCNRSSSSISHQPPGNIPQLPCLMSVYCHLLLATEAKTVTPRHFL